MITSAQMRAARALLSMDQRELADLSGLSLPTIQRMEASQDIVRGNVDSLMKLIAALDSSGLELIGEGAASHGGGRGVRLKAKARQRADRGHKKSPLSAGRRAG
jgi:transcriptional regulator with XRE-family HTH domain